MSKRWICLLLLLCLTLSSCVGSEDLMQAPRPAVQFQRLQKQISTLMTGGYTTSTPVAGDYRQAVVMFDLTGDGEEEALVFLRNETEIQMIVFSAEGDDYVSLPPVSENAESVHSVAFCDFDGDGHQEIAVGWQIAGLRSLSVYTLEGGAPIEILSRPYSSYLLYDMESTGLSALLLIQAGTAEQTGVAEMITQRGSEMQIAGTAYLSRGATDTLRVRAAALSDGKPGLFVASKYMLADTPVPGEVTDVFTYRDNQLINVSLNMESGVSDALVRTSAIVADDINNDGVLDLPSPVVLPRHPGDDETDAKYEIRWSAYDSNGLSVPSARTYHSSNNNWYLLLPEQWPEYYAVKRASVSAAQTVTTFSILRGADEPVDILRIYNTTLSTGDHAQTSGRTVLVDQRPLLITAELIPLKGTMSRYSISETDLKSLFHLIPTDWKGGV